MSRISPPTDSALAYTRLWDDLDHELFFHTLEDRLPSRLHLAKVIFLGNSRMQFGLDTDVLSAFFKPRGSKFYNLSFGYNQQSAWAFALLRKYQVQPEWLVINADPFFSRSIVGPGEQAITRAPFNSVTRYAEGWASVTARKFLTQAHLPRLRAFNAFGDNDSPVYRKIINGAWDLSAIPPYRAPTREFPVSEFPVEGSSLYVDWEAVYDFIGFAKKHGIRIVLINVPHTRTAPTSKACTRLISETCNLPYIDCDETGLTTFDEAHLTKRSATLYTERLLVGLAEIMDNATAK